MSRSDACSDKSNAFLSCSEYTSRTSSSDTSSCWDDTSDPEGDNINKLDPVTLCKRRRLERVLKMKMKRSNKSTNNVSCHHSAIFSHSTTQSSRASSLDKSHRRRLSNRESAERSRLKKNLLIDSLTARNCGYFVELQDLLAENEQLKTMLTTSEPSEVPLPSYPLHQQSPYMTLCDSVGFSIDDPQQRNDEVDSSIQQSFERIFDSYPTLNPAATDSTLISSSCELDSMSFDWTVFDWI